MAVGLQPDFAAKPCAKRDKLVVRRFGGDLMVYDRDLDHASCLNGFAADVWERCDGQSSIAEIAQQIAAATGNPVDERAVWLAVEQLSRSRLLEQPVKAPTAVFGSKKGRQRVRQALGAAAAALPAVMSIVIPTVAGAQSCLPSVSPCNLANPGACCSLTCVNHGGGNITCL